MASIYDAETKKAWKIESVRAWMDKMFKITDPDGKEIIIPYHVAETMASYIRGYVMKDLLDQVEDD